jgi:hypothetical protein
MSNGDPIRAGEQTVAFQTTCMFAEAQNYNFPSGSPMYFVGAPINTGNISTTDLDGLIARGNQGGSGVVGWGGTGQGTGVIGAGGVNFVFSNNGHTFIQEGGDGVEGAGGPGRSGFTLGSGLTPGGTTQPIEGGSGVLGYGGAGVGAGNIPENATNGVAANAGMGVFGRGGEAGGAPLPGSGAVGIAPDPNTLDSPYYVFQGNGVAGVGPTGVYGYSTEGVGVLGATYGPDRAGVVGINLLSDAKEVKGGSGVLGLGPVGGQGVTGQVFVSNTIFDSTTVAVYGAVTGNPKKAGNGPYAGWFDGPVRINGLLTVGANVVINGDLTVMGKNYQSVAVPFADGSLRHGKSGMLVRGFRRRQAGQGQSAGQAAARFCGCDQDRCVSRLPRALRRFEWNLCFEANARGFRGRGARQWKIKPDVFFPHRRQAQGPQSRALRQGGRPCAP